jgi:hypothetical protein
VSLLQDEKQLRPQEARQLVLNDPLDAGSTGGLVGYESPSQFSRSESPLLLLDSMGKGEAHMVSVLTTLMLETGRVNKQS